MKKLLTRIAKQFIGIDYNDLTTLEKKIADMLIRNGYMELREGIRMVLTDYAKTL